MDELKMRDLPHSAKARELTTADIAAKHCKTLERTEDGDARLEGEFASCGCGCVRARAAELCAETWLRGRKMRNLNPYERLPGA